MDLELKGRRALVTGSTKGIGEGIARLLAGEGARVIVHGRNQRRAEEVAARIGAAGIALGDLSTDEGADATCEAALAALGGHVEILVNNAGGGWTDPDTGIASTTQAFLDVTMKHWVATYQSNTLSAVRLIQRLVPAMQEAGFGRIIQISSAVGTQPNNIGPDYSSAKAGINNMTVSLAGALRGTGITVNTISPGIITTEGVLKSWGKEIARQSGWGDPGPEELERLLAKERLNLPVNRLGRVEDIGRIACLLASPLSGFVTGADHRVDGGQCRSVN
ncbi:SDR family NAD(P)-dependent oxidoreductase [Novosphingobium bradum]|uniref:SDR family NAD(P)-dependent oxidoreductase n=1 Tax=Novosphingobium bradum TaxID=1737444 RepID=A0ABV7IVZ5_9SPHN